MKMLRTKKEKTTTEKIALHSKATKRMLVAKATVTIETVREQRARLFEIEEQDAESPFVLVGSDGGEVLIKDTPRLQRAFLFEVEEQDAPSEYSLN